LAKAYAGLEELRGMLVEERGDPWRVDARYDPIN
jgi:hypothetical protein